MCFSELVSSLGRRRRRSSSGQIISSPSISPTLRGLPFLNDLGMRSIAFRIHVHDRWRCAITADESTLHHRTWGQAGLFKRKKQKRKTVDSSRNHDRV